MVIRDEMAGEDSPGGESFQLAMSSRSESEDAPPIFGSWARFYLAVVVYALGWIVGLSVLTRIWRV
jgi:hypothetical protein